MPEFNNPAWSEEQAELYYNLELARQDGDDPPCASRGSHARACLLRLEALEEE